jgi:hypothetical protein
MVLLSHAGGGTMRCQVILAMVLSSDAGDGATEASWSWSNVDAESY